MLPSRDATQEADIQTRVTPQALRRTFNTLLVEAGVNELVLPSEMGHTSRRMTSRYAGVHPSAKHELVERLRRLTQEVESLVGPPGGNRSESGPLPPGIWSQKRRKPLISQGLSGSGRRDLNSRLQPWQGCTEVAVIRGKSRP